MGVAKASDGALREPCATAENRSPTLSRVMTFVTANRCRVFHDVAAVNIQKVLNDVMGGDFGWLVAVTSP